MTARARRTISSPWTGIPVATRSDLRGPPPGKPVGSPSDLNFGDPVHAAYGPDRVGIVDGIRNGRISVRWLDTHESWWVHHELLSQTR